MDLADTEYRVAALDSGQRFDLIFDLRAADDFPRVPTAQFKTRGVDRATRRDECLSNG